MSKKQKESKEVEEKVNEVKVSATPKIEKAVVEFCSLCTFPTEFCEFSHAILLKKKELKQFSDEKAEEKKEETQEIDANATKSEAKEKAEVPSEIKEASDPKEVKEVKEVKETKDSKEPKETKETKETKEGEVKETKEEDKHKKKKGTEAPKVIIEESKRGKKKHTTYVMNLEKFGINLKDSAKMFSKKFACSANVTKEDNGQEVITLTGEFMLEMREYLLEKFGNILKDKDIKLIEAK